MPEGHMINFRLKPAEIRVLDEAAAAAGLTRSEFIRKAVWLAIHSYVPEEKKKDSLCPQGDPQSCQQAVWTKIGRGKICRTCGTSKGL